MCTVYIYICNTDSVGVRGYGGDITEAVQDLHQPEKVRSK